MPVRIPLAARSVGVTIRAPLEEAAALVRHLAPFTKVRDESQERFMDLSQPKRQHGRMSRCVWVRAWGWGLVAATQAIMYILILPRVGVD